MWKINLTSDQSLVIQGLINAFVNHPPEKLEWQTPFVQEHDALPLYIGWTKTTAIKPNGQLVVWNTEDDTTITEEMDRQAFHASLTEGARRYPELDFLIPERPNDAVLCEACQGTGKLEPNKLQAVICGCGGVGWIVQGKP